MTELTIVVSPAFDRRGKRRHGRFDVRLQGGDEVICGATQQPMLDASRVLPRRGVDPTTTICKVRLAVSRRGRSMASLADGKVLVGSSQQPFLDADALDDQVGRPNVHRRKARSDGLFAVGWADDADGPFESCGFAQVGTAEELPDESFRRAE
jgi:hypothetical protein